METEQQQPVKSPEPEETKFVDPPKKAQLDFAFKFIKQSIFTALEETENALNSLSWLDQSDNIPSNISEQDIMIMEETAQVGSMFFDKLDNFFYVKSYNFRHCISHSLSQFFLQIHHFMNSVTID